MTIEGAIGFVGLGVMGEPICRNIAVKAGRPVVAYDRRPEPLQRLAAVGVRPAQALAEVAEADLVFLSLPGGPEVEAVVLGEGGLLGRARAGQTFVDLSTCSVATAQRIAAALAEKGARFADAPVARTRQAAEAGTLSIMVGAEPEVLAAIRPILAAAASEITHCGGIGAGQVVKLMNNMVLFQTVVALAEALVIGRAAGVDGELLFETLSKGSADSFALRNHGMRSLLPGDFPEQAFATDYACKDLDYALALAEQHSLAVEGAALTRSILERTRRTGFGKNYFPALVQVIGKPD